MAWLEWITRTCRGTGPSCCVADLDGDGWFEPAERIAGDESTWVSQPRWDPDGSLWFTAEPGEWPRLHRWRAGDEPVAMTEDGIEFAFPDWVFGLANHQPLGDGRSVAIGGPTGEIGCPDRPGGAAGRRGASPYTELSSVAVVDDGVVILAAAPTEATAIVEVALPSGDARVLRPSLSVTIDPTEVSVGQPDLVPVDRRSDRVRGLLRTPQHRLPGARWRAATVGRDEPWRADRPGLHRAEPDRPGLHQPGHRHPRRRLRWVDRIWPGLPTLTRGRVGHRRRRRLRRRGGLAGGAGAGGRRTAHRPGGSASGFTTLAALAFRDTFDAGITYFGIGDLEAFVRETHKFESRYLDRLIGPLPEARELYEARSPNFHAEGISAPVLILQGAEDRIVPPAEAERIAEALAGNGIPHALLIFAGEDHGFRQEASIRQAFEAELSFLGQVFGFVAADDIQPVQLVTT